MTNANITNIETASIPEITYDTSGSMRRGMCLVNIPTPVTKGYELDGEGRYVPKH